MKKILTWIGLGTLALLLIGAGTNRLIKMNPSGTAYLSWNSTDSAVVVNHGSGEVKIGQPTEFCIMTGEKAKAAGGGTATADEEHIRKFDNTLYGDCSWLTRGSTTLDGNFRSGYYYTRWTLSKGKYRMRGCATSRKVGQNITYFYSVTGTARLSPMGIVAYDNPSSGDTTVSCATVAIDISVSTTYEFKHWVDGGYSNFGLGVDAGDFDGTYISHAQVDVTKFE